MVRLLVVLLVLVTPLALVGEAWAQTPVASLDEALRYLPTDSSVAATFDTDLAGEELRGLDAKLPRLGAGGGAIESELRTAAREELGLDFDRDVRPLLGNRLVIGLTGPIETGGVLAAIEVSDATLLAALARSNAVTPAGQSGGAPLFRVGDLAWAAVREDELDDGPAPGGLPWEAALRTVGVSASAAGEALSAEVSANTDPSSLSAADLPLASGPESPALVGTGAGGSAFGLRDPGQTARFLLAAYGLAGPRGDSGRDFNVDRDLSVLLGPSAAISVDARGRIASRTDVTDPAAFAGALRRSLPGILRLVPELADVGGSSRIRPLRGRDDLYLFTGPGQRVVLGLVEGRFATGPDERAARRIAVEPPVPFAGPGGAAAFSIAPPLLGLPPVPALGELTGSAEASLERVHLRLRLPVR
ncbi:MAG: hypothetical protein H0V55_06415 [Thermoleophilaceae bacterium]|nr:hypothetical protein [Thermoleophilaceae bacterium]